VRRRQALAPAIFLEVAFSRGEAMARRCAVTGKGVQVGHNVSHANNKTKRRFLPNLQQTSVLSDVLGPLRMRITAAGLRTIEHKGGIDAFLRSTPDRKLAPEIRRLKRRVAAAAARQSE
jgi:large subunit ribosomal protein L28